ncbi:Protein SPIRAL1-like 2 [Linum grandiflorum]
MSRGGSYGGGQSSLGYLFGSGSDKEPPPQSPTGQLAVTLPPYGIDIEMLQPDAPPSADPKEINDRQKPSPSNNYPRAQGQNSGNFITDRPSTKVKSVPGGDSSLGYLFGEN